MDSDASAPNGHQPITNHRADLTLIIMCDRDTSCRHQTNNVRKRSGDRQTAHGSVGDGGDNYSHPFWQKAKQKAQMGQPRGQRPTVRPPFAHKAQQAAGPPVIQGDPVPNPVPVSRPPRRHAEQFQRLSPRQMTPREPRQSQETLPHVLYMSDGHSHKAVTPIPTITEGL